MLLSFQEEILMMRQFDFPHVLSLHTAFVNHLDVFVISPVMCYNSCLDAMNKYFKTGEWGADHWTVAITNGICAHISRIPRDFSLPYLA